MARYAKPWDHIADIRRGAERLRTQERENTVRQFIRVGEIDADVVGTDQLQANSVTAVEINVGAVGASELADGSVGRVKIVNGAVNADKVEARSMIGDRLAIGTVGGSEIADGNVGTVEIADGAVKAHKIDVGVGGLGAISANIGYIEAGLIQGVTYQSAASGIRTVLDSGGLRLFNSTPGADSWSGAQWFEQDGSAVDGAIRCQLPIVSGQQNIRMEVVAITTIAADTHTSASLAVRGEDGARLGYVQVYGNGTVGSSDPGTASDMALKEGIEDVPTSLEVVKRLRPRKFRRRGGGRPEAGFVAQEVRDVLPGAVSEVPANPDLPDGSLLVHPMDLIAHTTRAVQEVASAVEALTARVAKLEPTGRKPS